MSAERRAPQGKELKIDRAIYVVDEERKRYRYLGRNHRWHELDPAENERNKRRLDGYTRIFPDGRTKVFRTVPPTRRDLADRVAARLPVTSRNPPTKRRESSPCPRQDSNLRTRLRRPALYPLSYEGARGRV
jgi:hypothetical protein